MDDPASRREYLFVVRIWVETDAQHAVHRWRGLVQHVASDQQIYFSSLDDLNDFIRLKIGRFSPGETA